MQSEAKMHPKSRIRAIWDTFAPEKVSQKAAKPPAQIFEPIGILTLQPEGQNAILS